MDSKALSDHYGARGGHRETLGLHTCICIWLAQFLIRGLIQEPTTLLPTEHSPKLIVREEKLFLPMRDAITLATNVYRRAEVKCSGPVLLLRTPFDKEGF